MKAELEFRASGKTRRYSWDYDPTFDIVETVPGTEDYKRLTDARGYDAEGAYSPDGKRIVFASNREAYATELSKEDAERLERDPSYFMDIYVMDADGSNVQRLTDANGYDGGPFWNPDGSKITWRRFSEDGARAEIFTMNADGSDQRQLTDLNVMSWAPFFHPSGEYLVFATNLHGFANFELYIVDAEGRRAPVRVTDREGFDGLATFTPDGRSISWTSNATPKKQSQISSPSGITKRRGGCLRKRRQGGGRGAGDTGNQGRHRGRGPEETRPGAGIGRNGRPFDRHRGRETGDGLCCRGVHRARSRTGR